MIPIATYDIRPPRVKYNVRTMDFANIFDDKFERYMILFNGLKVDYNEGGFNRATYYNLQYLDENNSVVSTASYTCQENGGYSANTTYQPISYENNVTSHTIGRSGASAETAYPIMRLWINNPYQNDRVTTFHLKTAGHDGQNYPYMYHGAGFFDGVDRFTGFRLTSGDGTNNQPTEGKIQVYGLDFG